MMKPITACIGQPMFILALALAIYLWALCGFFELQAYRKIDRAWFVAGGMTPHLTHTGLSLIVDCAVIWVAYRWFR